MDKLTFGALPAGHPFYNLDAVDSGVAPVAAETQTTETPSTSVHSSETNSQPNTPTESSITQEQTTESTSQGTQTPTPIHESDEFAQKIFKFFENEPDLMKRLKAAINGSEGSQST